MKLTPSQKKTILEHSSNVQIQKIFVGLGYRGEIGVILFGNGFCGKYEETLIIGKKGKIHRKSFSYT